MNRHLPKVAAAVLIVALLPATASAYSLWIDAYVNNTFAYRINETSFTTNIRGLSLTASQIRYWVRWSLTQWGAFSGSGLITSEGNTTSLGDTVAECYNRQDYSFIGAINGCETTEQCSAACQNEPDCGITSAITHPYQDRAQVSGRLEAAQVCFFGQAHNWEIDADGFASTERDIVGVMTHELGHALGLNHFNGTVMQFNSFRFGNTLARVPYGDDIEGIRAMYGQGTNTLKVGIYDNASSFEWISLPSTFSFRRYGATILEHPSTGTPYVAYSGPSNSGGSVHFTRTPYPVTANSAWTNRSLGNVGGTWVPPRMVSNADETVAVWPKKMKFYDGCEGIMVGQTSNAFDSMTTLTLADSCTLHPVSIAYDPTTELYVMAYLRHSMTASQNNRIMFRVSDDGTFWDDPIDSTIRSSLAPSVACSDGECVMTYNHRGVDAFPFHREISLGAVSHNVDVSSVATSISSRSLAPPSAAGRTLSTDIMLMWSNSGDSDVRFEPATSVPVTFDDQYWVSSNARYGGEIGIFSDVPDTNYRPHIFYVLR